MTGTPVPLTGYTEELQSEQSVLDRAWALLQAKAEHAAQAHHAAATPQARAALYELGQRVLGDVASTEPLMVGRVDGEDGDVLRIGRRLVRDEQGEVLVCSWQAPAAAPFYRATPRKPLGLHRRRTYQGQYQLLTGFSDEDFAALVAEGQLPLGHCYTAVAGAAGGGAAAPRAGGTPGQPGRADVRGLDALLDDLQRSRDGQMRDIVATIQADQYELITEPGDGVMVVQGGPGSGKTAVALHRASYLLYNDPLLAQQGVLVLGPNATFMTYVAQVLPGLDQTTITQWSMTEMLGSAASAPDTPERDALLGDARWIAVIDKLVRSSRQVSSRTIEVVLPGCTVSIPPPKQLELLRRVEATANAHNTGASSLREAVVRHVSDTYFAAVGRIASLGVDVEGLVRQDKGLRRACRNMWPEHSDVGLLGALLADLAGLVALADGVFSDEELLRAWRPGLEEDPEDFTVAEMYLLDELRHLLDGPPTSFGHVIVDEAQELMPMAVRAVARRLRPAAGATVLGDLAQAGPSRTVTDWQGLIGVLGRAPARVRTLTRGYRVPLEVLDLANRLIPLTGSSEHLTTSIRSVPGSVAVEAVERLDAAVVARAQALATSGSVAVIATAARAGQMQEPLFLPPGVALHEPSSVKGLEFDHVVVAEPGEFLLAGPAGARELFVAMTRCTKSLTLLHAEPLPDVLVTVDAAPLVPEQRQPPLSQERAMKHLLEAIALLALRRGMTLTGDDFLEFRASPHVHQEALALLDPSLRARVVTALST